jgi:hypothetical protein
MRAVVDLPLVPVMAMIGMRLLLLRGNSMSSTGERRRARALRRLQVHSKARRRVHFDDAAAGLAHRPVMSGAQEIDARYVEATIIAARRAISALST